MAGLIHIYCGDGKGKTTAAVGLTLRSAGAGNRVVFTQFFKDGSSSEIPLLRQIPHCKGNVMLTACILLGIMILPTIIGTTETALRSVPAMYHEGALALGATKERSVFTVIVPAAKSGVLTGIVLGIRLRCRKACLKASVP